MPLSLLNPDVGAATPFAVLLRWLPVALPLLLIQVTAEEVVFRGYLLQQLGVRSARPLVWMALPSALFGVLHYAPGDFGANAIWPALWAFVFGCLAADLTARTGNLGAALAMHFATNFSSIFLVGLYGNLDGLALYTLVINNRDLASLAPYLATDFVGMLVSWLLARLMLRV
nr:CPBP family intramembrane glutamic endopeptidase [Sinirhodobacter sp. WL0062]